MTRLAIMICGPDWHRAHQAMVTAAGALSLGRDVLVFAGGSGVLALARDWERLDGAAADSDARARGVAGYAVLREAVSGLGARLLACESGLRMAGLAPEDLAPGVEVAGVVRFLEEAADGPFMTF
ncbi:DsrE family protein [Acidomonas methanolica]|uniref:DsrE family protein n=1 Tax=Acidomonas methanolica TaxID=437 RepID=UPI002119F023|nr:DsrE family protein [Acidomonas methanolica]MCQ9154047.1 DsrE family protein [Acidomonas methanolica]